ncbi:MAG: hypothetical protein ACK4H7_01335, partial [Acidilobaceae archaeon]
DGLFPVRGYAGVSGRVDVLARCFSVTSLVDPEACIVGFLLGSKAPKALVGLPGCCGGFRERDLIVEFSRVLRGDSSRFLGALEVDFKVFLDLLVDKGFKVLLLSEKGYNVMEEPQLVCGRVALFLGSHVDMPGWVEDQVRRFASSTLSIGPYSLHSEHVIAFLGWLRMRYCQTSSRASAAAPPSP